MIFPMDMEVLVILRMGNHHFLVDFPWPKSPGREPLSRKPASTNACGQRSGLVILLIKPGKNIFVPWKIIIYS